MKQSSSSNSTLNKNPTKTILGAIPNTSQIIGAAVTALLIYLLWYGAANLNQSIPAPKTVAKINTNKVALSPMTLTATNSQNHFTINGSVPSEAIKMNIENELRASFGEGHYTNNLSVNDQIKPAKWLDHLKGFFDFFKIPGAELSTTADVLTLSGTAISLKNDLTAFVGPDTTVKALDIASNVQAANSNALSNLNGLSVNSSTQAILDAMNMQIINFASGSSQIPTVNQEVLKKAATLLKSKTDAFEISGHADNVGNEISNVKLSEQRAKAVRDFLVKQQVPVTQMSAKGYGSSTPVVSNDTETGRLKNRRIEYRLQK